MSRIGEFESKLESCLIDIDGSLVLSLRIPSNESDKVKKIVQTIKTGLASGKERLRIEIGWWRDKRSLNANSYFHVLVDKIAKALQIGADECKRQLVLEYGTIAMEGGDPIIVTFPKNANPINYYPYPKWISDFIAKNGKPYSQYILYKQTHTLDTAEMARLIDGTVFEAKELDIETRTPEEIARLLESWVGCNE